jgi:hypothetical protein
MCGHHINKIDPQVLVEENCNEIGWLRGHSAVLECRIVYIKKLIIKQATHHF